LCDAAYTLWLLGYPEQAIDKSSEALTLAKEINHPFSLAFALCFAACLQHFCRRSPTAKEYAKAVIILCTEQGFPNWLAWTTVIHGWALAEQGQRKEGIAQMYEGLSMFQAIGAELTKPYNLALLADSLGKARRREEGLSVLAEALALIDKNGEYHYEAELYRIKGELLSQIGIAKTRKTANETEAEECFQQAVSIARRQSAKSWELRAAVSLSRLWQRQGKKKAARQLLAEIYGWFTEGFDTADLKDAKSLLEELS
jgi:predicted ATPase